MKKVLVGLLLVTVKIFAKDESQESCQAASWKDSMMAHWNALSETHKMIIYGLAILVVLLVGYRLLKCGAAGCGCGCSGNCNCDK